MSSKNQEKKVTGKKSMTRARDLARQPILMEEIGLERGGNLFPRPTNYRPDNFSTLPSVSRTVSASMNPSPNVGTPSNAALMADNIRRSQ